MVSSTFEDPDYMLSDSDILRVICEQVWARYLVESPIWSWNTAFFLAFLHDVAPQGWSDAGLA